MKCAGIVFICCLFVLCTPAELPDFVQLCPRDSPNISQCIKNSIENLRPHLVKGIPELKIPSIAPLVLPKVKVNVENSSNVNYQAVLRNANVTGLENYEVLNVAFDLSKPSLSLNFRYPKLDMHTEIITKGKLLAIPFDGTGIVEGTLNGGVFNAEWSGKKITKNGKEYAVFKLAKHTFKTDGSSISVKDLFKNNPELNDNLNKMIKENIDLLKVESNFEKISIDVIGQFINGVFDLYSLDQLFPQK